MCPKLRLFVGAYSTLSLETNQSLENSLRQRLNAFGNEESPLLLGKKKGDYRAVVQSILGSASSQQEYNCLLDSENRLDPRAEKSMYVSFERGTGSASRFAPEMYRAKARRSCFIFSRSKQKERILKQPLRLLMETATTA
uniref:Putative mitochondrial protein AtMg01280 n=1 Tax=Anthurium amnicola TaxID=1678845 RepID=A0A1D1XRD0_9ARAE